MAVYWKRAVGDEVDYETLTWQSAPDNINSAIMYRYSNVFTSGGIPSDFGFVDASGGSPEASATIKGGTTLGIQRLMINVLMCVNTTSTCTVGNATGWTQSQTRNGNIGSGYMTTKAQERQVATASTISDYTSSLSPSSLWVADSFALIPGTGWPHHFLGVDNANIGKITGVDKADIEAVNTIT